MTVRRYLQSGARSIPPVVRKSIPQPLYRKIHESMPIVCVDLVVKRGREFLLLRRVNKPAANRWYIPGGRLLKNESVEAAALRKLRQETGLGGTIGRLLLVAEVFHQKGYFPGVSSHIIVLVFFVKPEQGPIRLDSQNSSFRWFGRINPRWQKYVKDALRAAGFR